MNLDLDFHLAAIALGDALAFTRWVAAAEAPIRGSLCKFAARVDVEVVVQETLLRMWQVAPRVVRDGQANALLRLALRTARNLAIDDLRRAVAVKCTATMTRRSMIASRRSNPTRGCAKTSCAATRLSPTSRVRRCARASIVEEATPMTSWPPAFACGSTRSTRTWRVPASCWPSVCGVPGWSYLKGRCHDD